MSTFLRRLELHGFKSFAGKTTLEFPSRIAGIVGPNGSGKSNVIDALRWVLGEREAKQLRGQTLENLIFAGTPKKPPMGFASVTLVFDNRDGLFPSDAKEVSLSRRVDRSGTSSFLLNDEEIRLRDLLPLLARAQLGTRGITMIGQGQSTIFVESSPDARRTMIEEVLGLKEFRMKKHDAERRLASSEANLEKVRAQIAELTPHLSFLRRQRKKWERRAEIATELRDLEDRYYGGRMHALLREEAALTLPAGELALRGKEASREIEKLEEGIRALKRESGGEGEAHRLREGISLGFSRQAELERALARAEVEMEYAEKSAHRDITADAALSALKFSESELRRALASQDISLVRSVIEGVLKRIEETIGGKAEKKDASLRAEEQKRLVQALAELDIEMKALEAKREGLLAEQDKANEEFRSRIEALEARKNELRKIEREAELQRFEHEKVQLRLQEVEREWLAFGREKGELAALPEPEEAAEGQEIERKMFRLRGQIAEVGEIDQALVAEADESEKRHEFLTRELEDVEGAADDLKKLIRDLELRIHDDFKKAFKKINEEFQTYFALMFGGGKARLRLERPVKKPALLDASQGGLEVAEEGAPSALPAEEEGPETKGVEIEVSIPRKKIANLDMLSGGEKSLVSLAALFALISVSPPPFLVLDEIDAALDDANARRFAELVVSFSKKSQFVIVTHNHVTMEAADVLYGVTMADDGVSKLLSIQLTDPELTKKAK